jgi:hypothetical protein
MPRVTINDSSEQELFTASNPGLVQMGAGSAEIGVVDILYKALAWLPGTVAALGQTELVAAPGAGQRIVVTLFLFQNLTAVATTVILEAGTTDLVRGTTGTQYSSFSGSFLVGRELKLPVNTALNVDLSGANSHNYNVAYYTESV